LMRSSPSVPVRVSFAEVPLMSAMLVSFFGLLGGFRLGAEI
jgi:hypothetical protein